MQICSTNAVRYFKMFTGSGTLISYRFRYLKIIHSCYILLQECPTAAVSDNKVGDRGFDFSNSLKSREEVNSGEGRRRTFRGKETEGQKVQQYCCIILTFIFIFEMVLLKEGRRRGPFKFPSWSN